MIPALRMLSDTYCFSCWSPTRKSGAGGFIQLSGGKRRFRYRYEIADAIGNGIVIEVIGRMVKAGRIAIAEEDIGAGTRFQHVGKIFRRHHRLDTLIHFAFARHSAGDAGGKLRLRIVVVGDRIIVLVAHGDFHTGGGCDTGGSFTDTAFGKGAGFLLERADRARQRRLSGITL